MKRFLTLMLALLMVCSCVVAFASCKKEETVILGFDAGYPPFGYKDTASGEYVGFDIEYAKKVFGEDFPPY